MSTTEANSSHVINFYDRVARSPTRNSLIHRDQTRILYLRNFNNWIKSIFISEYLDKCRSRFRTNRISNALDLCCGKGGDQYKWALGAVNHVTFIDISSGSVDVCKSRYQQLCRRRYRLYTADFHVADCTKDLTETVFRDRVYDLISCQFSFHYAFESLTQARNFLKNVSSCLRNGGFYIATIPNAYELVRRANVAYKSLQTQANTDSTTEPSSISFGNSVYSVNIPSTSFSIRQLDAGSDDKSVRPYLQFPLFGARYEFHLEGAVDCPEFLVYPPLLNHLAAEQGLFPVTDPIPFQEYFYEMLSNRTSSSEDPFELLTKMKALECWPNPSCSCDNDWQDDDDRRPKLVGSAEADAYAHVEQWVEKADDPKCCPFLGTLSKAEWDVVTLYSLVAFQKR
ncbi:unnamed protein product [Calicophoron daubneyi]|uniref:mRNA cap guanine-N(7) methyltransferase n=1 Tax=Calicophoron daubneyi TaxID=300641 RepID=A0AAV2TPB0_CALDB